MSMEPSQAILLEIAEQPPRPRSDAAVQPRALKLKPIDRSQGLLRAIIVDELVGADHKARAIWDLTGEFDLSRFHDQIGTREGAAGSSAWDPRAVDERLAVQL